MKTFSIEAWCNLTFKLYTRYMSIILSLASRNTRTLIYLKMYHFNCLTASHRGWEISSYLGIFNCRIIAKLLQFAHFLKMQKMFVLAKSLIELCMRQFGSKSLANLARPQTKLLPKPRPSAMFNNFTTILTAANSILFNIISCWGVSLLRL